MGGASLSRRSGPRKEFLVIGSPLLDAAQCLDEAPTGTLVVSRQSFELISDHFSSEVTEHGNARIRCVTAQTHVATSYPFLACESRSFYISYPFLACESRSFYIVSIFGMRIVILSWKASGVFLREYQSFRRTHIALKSRQNDTKP